ncbi:MAG: substrate-binding domain-containing protein [Spirochaetota bacterium]
MKDEGNSKKITRREALKRAGTTAAGLAAGSVLGRFINPVNVFAGKKEEAAKPEKPAAEVPARAKTEEDRRILAQKYKNAEPGEKFGFGHITWHLAQEYAIIDYQAQKQACEQLGLNFMGAVADTESAWIGTTESMIAKGAKALHYNVPPMSVMPELVRICNENNVYLSTHFGYTGDVFPGDYGPRWVVDNTPLSDEQTYFPLMLLMEKMKQDGRTKLLHHQASKTAATVSTVYINLGVFMAWKNYPEMKLLGHQYGEWGYEGGRKAAQASLAERTDYEGFWGANDSQTTGALRALRDHGLNIGPFTASRDMELTTAQEILKGNFLVTSGFAIPYFGGRMVPMLYDMCVGAWYPLENEMIQAGRLDCYGRPGEIERLAEASGVIDHPSFSMGPTRENMERILREMKKDNPQYPYDFRLLSKSKCEELGLEYDRHAGGGTDLAPNSHDFYFPAKLKKFGSLKAIRDHVGALHKYFLDFNVDTWAKAEELADQLPPEIKTKPVWQ